MSDRPQRPAANRRANPAGAAPPKPEAAIPAGEPAAPALPESSAPPNVPPDAPTASVPPGDRADAIGEGRQEPPASAARSGAAIPSDEPPDAAARDYPEMSAPARGSSAGGSSAGGPSGSEPAGTLRFGENGAATPFRDPIPPASRPREAGYRGLALGLVGGLLLVLALLASAPLWMPLLPWGAGAGTDPAIVERLDAEQQQIRNLEQQINTAAAATPRLEQRVATLEQKPPPAAPDLGEMRTQVAAVSSGLSELTPRLERLENAVQAQAAGLSEVKTGLDQLAKNQQAQAAALSDLKTGFERLGQTTQGQAAGLSELRNGLERLGQTQQAQQQALAGELAARLTPLQQGLQAQQSSVAALGSRLQNFEKATQSRAGDLTDMGLMLALMQIRDAVETGRPFAAEYNALSSLAKNRPEIAAAAAPLADAARTGVADRAELARELSALAQRIEASPAAADTGGGWTGAVLDRLRGLVRVRRANEADPGKEEAAAIAVAERALAGGDLRRAVAAIETLQGPAQGPAQGPGQEPAQGPGQAPAQGAAQAPGQGPAASAISDWLRQARERLAVEGALQRLEALLTARLGGAAAPSPAPAAASAPGAPG